jgi:chemotaxis family two-component system response regulator Rcp1
MIKKRQDVPYEILLVEDDPGNVLLTQEALNEGKYRIAVNDVSDGVAAMAYLNRRPPYADAARPDLILLDLNMPGKDGREVLAEIKADRDLRSIPVVILTTSGAEEDVLRSYDLHANAYVQKPLDMDQFVNVIQTFDEFFLSVVRLPQR